LEPENQRVEQLLLLFKKKQSLQRNEIEMGREKGNFEKYLLQFPEKKLNKLNLNILPMA